MLAARSDIVAVLVIGLLIASSSMIDVLASYSTEVLPTGLRMAYDSHRGSSAREYARAPREMFSAICSEGGQTAQGAVAATHGRAGLLLELLRAAAQLRLTGRRPA